MEQKKFNVSGTRKEVTEAYLMVFFAPLRLTDKQLAATTALAVQYAQYVEDGVKEPYASTLLFATDKRKELADSLQISSANLNNIFGSLTKKGILAFDNKSYSIHPNVIPTSSLMFNFKVVSDASTGRADQEGSESSEASSEQSEGDNN